ncbi:hypothetical protein [Niastella sp. OAS944]|uniref:hypothetical protein n=1 Tax=Niastella sp. OAS944 TaxID=2664089 RepID=UPI003471E09F|nr:hypothetical protein [Chitinophagaceae bacterium OAS944]
MFNFFRKKKKDQTPPPSVFQNDLIGRDESIPDTPECFGPKCIWFAIPSENPLQVAETMNLGHLEPCNWYVGVRKAYEGEIFVTPPVDGYTMVLGWGLPTGDTPGEIEKVKNVLSTLSNVFGEAQYFGTHRTSGFCTWMKAVNGNVIRVYGYADGENLIVEGEPTEYEAGLNLLNTFSEEAKQKDYYSREDITHPHESTVMEIAANWSIDPSELHKRKDLQPGLGYLSKTDIFWKA